ncbi:uncharacterized, partial [Tachysurus ichikawai]
GVYKMEQGFCSSLETSFCLLLFDPTPLLSESLNTLATRPALHGQL